MNHRDINLISFFNRDIIYFIINIYSDDQQNTLKYLEDIEVNLNNVIIMTGDFNIRYNDWDLSYSHHLIHANILMELADSFGLGLSILVDQVPTEYIDNLNDFNSVIDLMFLRANSEKFNSYSIIPNLRSPLNHSFF